MILEDVANRLGGRRYDLARPEDRRALRGSLSTFIRPEAKAVLLEIAPAGLDLRLHPSLG